MKQETVNLIKAIVSEDKIFVDELMKKHTTFRIGGMADVLVKPESEQEVLAVCRACREAQIPCIIIGNGSNLLVSDKGIRGVVIKLFENFSDIKVEGDIITAKSGASLSKLGKLAQEHSLTGFEFACGIPGTLGGACVMNAGAYGGEMKDILLSVTAMDKEGNVKEYFPEDMELAYRSSIFAKEQLIVLSAKLKLAAGNQDEIQEKMKDLAFRRRDKQPLEYPSAGSTFKRPDGYFAGKLIMDAGLRGFSVGDAAVSEKHCGFVINKGNATATDVCELMKQVSQRVNAEFGVSLEPEVKLVGEF